MADVLLTISGVLDPTIADQVAAGTRPRPDYLAMAEVFPADLLDYTAARRYTGWFGRVLERLGGPNLTLAWACFRQQHQYKLVFTDGEQVGMPFAGLATWLARRRARHFMLVHILSVRKKTLVFDLLRLQTHIDRFFVYASWQKQFIERRFGVASDRVVWTPFMVDAHFFNLAQVTPKRRRMICAVGLEFRDYPTLIKAVAGLDVDVVIAAASPWSKRSDSSAGESLPPNVTVRRFSQFELRQLYADSAFVVMPLYNVEFQAGVTAILEAMAMERAVICSRTTGQTDVVVDGETGLYVPPADPAALRSAIEQLLAEPQRAEQMGKAGRLRIEQHMSLDCYTRRLATFVQSSLDQQG